MNGNAVGVDIMLMSEILTEAYSQIWDRGKSGPVRRYRCTSGAKKGRTVSKPATCTSPVKHRSHATQSRARMAHKKQKPLKFITGTHKRKKS